MNDADYERMAELTMLEVECAVLAADTKAEADAADAAEVTYLVQRFPDSRLAELEAELSAHARSQHCTPGANSDVAYSRFRMELACYGWRRDYDEWPTFQNLADRLATENGITHRLAERRILAAVNDPAATSHLHCIRTARLAEILNDEDSTIGPWQAGEVESLRFYVTAEAVTEFMVDTYDNGRRAEAVA